MKYLSTYKLFESTDIIQDDMVSDLKYLIIDITDLGYFTDISHDKYIITITISRLKDPKGFIRNEEELNVLRDDMNRIKDYGRSCGHLVDLTWVGRINNLSIEEFNKIVNDNRNTMYITMYPKNR